MPKITHRLRKECKETEKEGVVLIGDGTFNPGGTGQAAVPKKAFIRQFATMYPVIITNEFRTSKLHPLSFTELADIKTDKDTATKERLHQCKTESGNSKVDDIVLKARDRDNFGSCSILQCGFYRLIKNPIDAFKR